ncbi:ferric iron reductase [Azospirillum doebereinerae]|nr:ferric iron reductase [Azospirillum doebereinerae]MCG5239397.1 ferric iron reductase [Azospirillum doebereinerae]
MTIALSFPSCGCHLETPTDPHMHAIQSGLAALGTAVAAVASRLALVPVQDRQEPARAVLKVERLCSLLEEGQRYGTQGSRQERASAWIRGYFRILLPAMVAPAFAGIRMYGAVANCRLGLRAGQPVAVASVTAPALGVRVNVEDLYGPLLADHAERVVRAAYAATGLSPRIAWSHAGEVLTNLFRPFDALPALAETVDTHRLVVFGVPANAWFPINNPLFRNPCAQDQGGRTPWDAGSRR